MASDGIHFAPVIALDRGDFVIIGTRVVEVDNTPRDDVEGAYLTVEGTTLSQNADHWERVSKRFGTADMIPRIDDDFDFEGCSIDNGRVFQLDRWPNEPVIYVVLAQENRFVGSTGTTYTVEVSGFYVRHVHSDSFSTYVSLDGESLLDQSAGDRIIKWRKATPTDFVVEQEKTNE